jgi:hypothetical protein
MNKKENNNNNNNKITTKWKIFSWNFEFKSALLLF